MLYRTSTETNTGEKTTVNITKNELWNVSSLTLTSGGAILVLGLLAVQVLQQLHGFASHDDLLEHRLEEGHHGVLSAAGRLLSARASTGSVAEPLLALHRLRHTIQRVSGVPEVPVVYWYIFVPSKHVHVFIYWISRCVFSRLKRMQTVVSAN